LRDPRDNADRFIFAILTCISRKCHSAILGADYERGPLTVHGAYVFKNGGQARVSANEISYPSVRRDLDLYTLWNSSPS
jgi:hypothetical protein